MFRVGPALAFGSALALGTFQSAFAADIPARMATKAPAVVVAPSWTGFYLGIHGGGGFADSD